MNTILVTGSAGFIGMHMVKRLLKSNFNVIGIDSVNKYYDVNLKYNRLAECGVQLSDKSEYGLYRSKLFGNYLFYYNNLRNAKFIRKVFQQNKIDIVIHLAAQAGVRYSLDNPKSYHDNNLVAFFNIIDAARLYDVKTFLYASSSSVYGDSLDVPFNEDMVTDKPVSFYAATKKCNEVIAFSYSKIFDLKTIGLRFFTVYGPWGRPDMAYFMFTERILKGKPIEIFNKGELKRDFTYIDDIIEGIHSLVYSSKNIPNSFSLFNIGNNAPIDILEFVSTIERKLGREAILRYKEMQKGDVRITYANTEKLNRITGYKSMTSIEKGIDSFVNWYNHYYFGI